MKRILVEERRNMILQTVLDSGSIDIHEAAARFNVSTETIRKDILYLEEKGLVIKQYGGAVAVPDSIEKPIAPRIKERIDEKNKIAQKAMQFVPQKGIVVLDAGSTVMCLAKLIKQMCGGLIIITNAINIVETLKNSKNTVYLIGGEYRFNTDSVSGLWAVQALKSIKADVAFMGTSGFMSHNGPCAESFVEAEVKQAMVACSKERYVLADSSKFNANALVEYAEWLSINALITSEGNIQGNIEEIQKQVQIYFS